jgi:hypothetical protein
MVGDNPNLSNPTVGWIMRYLDLRHVAHAGVVLAVSALFTSAHAELVQYEYTTPDGDTVTADPRDRDWINAEGAMEFALSAGLDRQVRIRIVDSGGDVVAEDTSAVIGANDTITVNGEQFFGHRLTLDAPTDDGEYDLRAQIVDTDEGQVAEDAYRTGFDRNAPSVGGASMQLQGRYVIETQDGVSMSGERDFNNILLDDIPQSAEVDSVHLETTDSSGTVHGPVEASYDEQARTAVVENWKTIFPNPEDTYDTAFILEDRAGNRTRISQAFGFDRSASSSGKPEPVAVYDPTQSSSPFKGEAQGYVAYEPGMTVHTNPIRFLYRIPADNYKDETQFGLGNPGWCMAQDCMLNDYVFVNDDYYYVRTQKRALAALGDRTLHFKTYDQTRNGVRVPVEFHAADSMDKAPELVGQQDYRFSDGWFNDGRRINAGDPNTATRVRVEVESRPYTQEVCHRGGDCVELAPGETTASWDISDLSFSGADATWPDVQISGAGMTSKSYHAGFYWDTVPPEYDSHDLVLDDEHMVLNAVETNGAGSWKFKRWKLTDETTLTAINSDGEEFEVPQQAKERTSKKNFTFRFDLDDLPEGTYSTFRFAIHDAFDNVTTKTVTTAPFTQDRTAPSLTFLEQGEAFSDGGSLYLLQRLTVELDDNIDRDPQITQARLTSGPEQENVRLAWSPKEKKGAYQLEYPVMFPSMEPGEDYELDVQVADDQGNTTSNQVRFFYEPELVEIGQLDVPQTPADSAPWTFQSRTLKTTDGAPLTGTSNVIVKVGATAAGSVTVNGEALEPGSTLEISDYDFDDPNIAFDIQVAQDTPAGKRPILIEIVDPRAPTLVGTVRSWKGGANLESATDWSPVAFLQDVEVTAAADEQAACELTTDAENARASTASVDTLRNKTPKCLIEWQQTPSEVSAQTGPDSDPPSLVGRLADTDDTPVRYRVSVFDGQGNRSTVATGEQMFDPEDPDVAFSVDGGVPDEVTQLYERVQLGLEQEQGMECSPTASADEAKRAAEAGEPKCLVEWMQQPANLGAQATREYGNALEGYIPHAGDKTIAWKARVFAADGSDYVLQKAERAFKTVAPTLELEPQEDLDGTYRQVQALEITPRLSDDSTSCQLVVREKDFNASNVNPNNMCVLRFDQMPEGMERDTFSQRPRLTGRIPKDGVKDVAWTMLGVSSTGEVIDFGSDHFSFKVVNPPEPHLEVSDTEQLEDGSIPVSVTGQRFGMAKANAPLGELELIVEGLSEGNQTRGGGSSGFGEPVETDISLIMRGAMDALWKHEDLQVKARYARLPGISTSKEIAVYGVPGDNISAFLLADQETLNTEDLDAQVKIGNRSGGQVEFDAAQMGQWSGEVGVNARVEVAGSSLETTTTDNPGVAGLIKGQSVAGYRVYLDGRMTRIIEDDASRELRTTRPVTSAQTLTDGAATFSIDPGDQSARMFKGVATLQSPDGIYQRRIETNPITIQVLEGNPLDPDVLTRRTSGPAPYRTIVNLRFDQMGRDALGKVEWLVRGEGRDQWKTVESGDKLTRLDHTFEAGEYQLRAKLENRYSGEVSQTKKIGISAYREPDLTVSGGTRTFPGKPLELKAEPMLDGASFDAAKVQWRIDGETVGTGRTFSVERDEPTGVRVIARARAREAPADDPHAWTEVRHAVRVSRPRAPRVRIDGPRTVDLADTETFRTQVRMPFPGMSRQQFPVEGHWVLPNGDQLQGQTVEWEEDGETFNGSAIDYSPSEEARDAGLAKLTYVSWIKGYKEATTSKQSNRVRVTEYVWPDFTIQVQRSVKFAPSSMRLIVRTPGFHGRLDEPQYAWDLPASATDVRKVGSRASLALPEAGTHDIEVTVTDARGNESSVTVPVEVLEAKPFEISADLRFSNDYQREPVDLYARFRADGGHPSDRTDQFTYRLNGEVVQGPSVDRTVRLQDLEAGRHDLSVDMTSDMGATATWRRTIRVKDNDAPVCKGIDVEYREAGPYYIMEANCTDEDGRITAYRWNSDLIEEPRETTSRYAIRDDRDEKSTPIELMVTAVDNAGGETTMTRSLTPPK